METKYSDTQKIYFFNNHWVFSIQFLITSLEMGAVKHF